MPWTTPGGDVSTNASYTSSSPTAVAAQNAWFSFPAPLATVQGWVGGGLPNHGFLLSTDPGAPGTQAYVWASTEASMSSQFPADSTKWPALDVTWTAADSVAPSLTLSGDLAQNQATWRDEDAASVTLAGTDAGSGVERLELLDGATVIDSYDAACTAGGCSLSHDFTVDLVALGEGVHTLTAAAIDAEGLRDEETFTVRVDRAVPALALSGSLVDLQGTPATSGSRTVDIAATDSGAGITALTLSVDGLQQEAVTQPCAAGGCSRNESWSVDVGALGDGAHSVVITATDGSGRVKSETLEVLTERFAMPPVPPLSDSDVTPFPEQVDFLWTGSDPLQTGVAPGTIDAKRTAVITGKVFNGEGVPAAGVKVSVVGHPELGETLSRDTGEYFLGVNGGAQLRLRYEVQGALPSERDVETKWSDYTVAPDVWLVGIDPVGTQVDFGAATPEMQVAESSQVTDDDGTRSTMVLVRPGTQATKQMADGSTEPLVGGTMRMTEYTVGEGGRERMPAGLPDSTAYTWAADFRIDQASDPDVEHVLFSKPVVAYTENFLGFPVGMDIPIGTYEPSQGRWDADPDGRVIEILSEVDGKAVVDVTGFGPANAQELLEFGIDEEELEQLALAYEPGETLWRTQLTRFSSVDGNCMVGVRPGWKGPGNGPFGPDKDDQCEESGSIIGCQNQSLGEVLARLQTLAAPRIRCGMTPPAPPARSAQEPFACH